MPSRFRDPSHRGDWLAAFALPVVVLVVAIGYATNEVGLVPAPCDDVASCAYPELGPAGIGLGLMAVIVGCLVAGATALVGARRRP